MTVNSLSDVQPVVDISVGNIFFHMLLLLFIYFSFNYLHWCMKNLYTCLCIDHLYFILHAIVSTCVCVFYCVYEFIGCTYRTCLSDLTMGYREIVHVFSLVLFHLYFSHMIILYDMLMNFELVLMLRLFLLHLFHFVQLLCQDDVNSNKKLLLLLVVLYNELLVSVNHIFIYLSNLI